MEISLVWGCREGGGYIIFFFQSQFFWVFALNFCVSLEFSDLLLFFGYIIFLEEWTSMLKELLVHFIYIKSEIIMQFTNYKSVLQKKTFLDASEYSSSGTGCTGRLCSFCPWRFLRAGWIKLQKSLVRPQRWAFFHQEVGLETPEGPFCLIYPVILDGSMVYVPIPVYFQLWWIALHY